MYIYIYFYSVHKPLDIAETHCITNSLLNLSNVNMMSESHTNTLQHTSKHVWPLLISQSLNCIHPHNPPPSMNTMWVYILDWQTLPEVTVCPLSQPILHHTPSCKSLSQSDWKNIWDRTHILFLGVILLAAHPSPISIFVKLKEPASECL